jgi:hypothetical protein
MTEPKGDGLCTSDWLRATLRIQKSRPTRISDASKVFAELDANNPDNVSYIVLRLADESFVHVSFHGHTDDEVNPIASAPAFAHFQDRHADRRSGGVDQQTATLVGAYITRIE